MGDKICVDIEGSRKAGMVPVLYKCPRNRYDAIPESLRVMEDFMDLVKLVNLEK